MTDYKIVYKDNDAVIEVKGHSNYAPIGEDIVCAAISTACIMTANLIDKLNLRYNILDLVCEEGYFRLQVQTKDPITLGIFNNLTDTLESISKEYPKYLRLKS